MEFVLGQVILCPLPQPRRFGDMSITVERWKVLRHRRKFLNGHEYLLRVLRPRMDSSETLLYSLQPDFRHRDRTVAGKNRLDLLHVRLRDRPAERADIVVNLFGIAAPDQCGADNRIR